MVLCTKKSDIRLLGYLESLWSPHLGSTCLFYQNSSSRCSSLRQLLSHLKFQGPVRIFHWVRMLFASRHQLQRDYEHQNSCECIFKNRVQRPFCFSVSSGRGCGYLSIHTAQTYCIPVVTCQAYERCRKSRGKAYISSFPFSTQELSSSHTSGRLRSEC